MKQRPTDIWNLVHAERTALIDDLQSLPAARWEEPSLCRGWSVHDVVAHLIDSALTTRVSFVAGLAAAGFDFDRQNDRGMRRHRGTNAQQTLQALRAVASRRTTPPAPLESRLVEEVVHGEDIRRSLGLTRAYPVGAVVAAAHLQARTPGAFGGAKELLRRIRLQATDADLALGDGPVLEGPALELLLVTCGRAQAAIHLTGPGLQVLAP